MTSHRNVSENGEPRNSRPWSMSGYLMRALLSLICESAFDSSTESHTSTELATCERKRGQRNGSTPCYLITLQLATNTHGGPSLIFHSDIRVQLLHIPVPHSSQICTV